jgi:signal transduction histidine kinase
MVDAFNDMLSTIERQNLDLVTANERLEGLVDELGEKNEELERFVYTVSHDLKSPLITINGFLGLLERDARSGHAERMEQDVRRIQSAVDKMARLLDELLELSRIGRQRNPPQETPLSELATEAMALVAGSLDERGVTVDVQPDMPVVHGDRPRLLEVVQNLIENGVKFMGDQADPRIEIGTEPSRAAAGETVVFVRDNGVGIAAKYHEQIFGLFERLETATEGTGVGLAIVKRIVEVHGGRIWVESEGQRTGATFFFTLPIADGTGWPTTGDDPPTVSNGLEAP